MNVIEGLFEVERLDGEALVAVNLIDELTYRIHSNLGDHVREYRVDYLLPPCPVHTAARHRLRST